MVLMQENTPQLHSYHFFLDEAGDMTFYGKGRIPIIGTDGVSKAFILGMVKFNANLSKIRNELINFQNYIANSPYYRSVDSVKKRVNKGGYYFHAKDDLPEIRKEFFDWILNIDFSFHCAIGRKILSLYERKHNGKAAEFYADLLSHLLEPTMLNDNSKIVLNIAELRNVTAFWNLSLALEKAKDRLSKRDTRIETKIVFNVQPYISDPLLSVADYMCWAVQRNVEKGESRFLDYISSKVVLNFNLYPDDI